MTTPTPLPANVYCLPQAEFDAIPGRPWVYWITPNLRKLFTILRLLGDLSPSLQGLATTANFRFIRKWWETGTERIAFNCKNGEEAFNSEKKWFPYMKGGNFKRWYGNQEDVVLWNKDGQEIRELVKLKYRDASYAQGFSDERWDKLIDIWVVKNRAYYFREGITYSYLTSGNFSARLSPGGFIFDVAGSSLFPENISLILGVMNSNPAAYLLKLINPTVNFQVGDLARLPIPAATSVALNNLVSQSFHLAIISTIQDETTFKFIVTPDWNTGLQDLAKAESRLSTLQAHVDNEVYQLYGIVTNDRTAIESELTGGVIGDDEESSSKNNENDIDIEVVEAVSTMSPQELATRYISYAMGVALGRFQPGRTGSLGSAIYRSSDFAIGSLPVPSEEEFNELVGMPNKYAYIDEHGGRHVFAERVEQFLRALAIEDGITVMEAGHPRDLVARVYQALELMLGEQGAAEVIHATGGEATSPTDALRKFLEKDYFTGWLFRWYRKRPIYWPIQSAKHSYGFVLFHEKVTRDTFYAIQREPYLDTKRNAVANAISDLETALRSAQGAERKRKERELDDLRKLAAELDQFAKELESITSGGYNPAPDWIDDGVILRLAPLWKVIPIWKTEPKKYWDRLEAGEFDWSHIAMNYWPERVKAKCKTNKSYAIAHGHEEWYSES